MSSDPAGDPGWTEPLRALIPFYILVRRRHLLADGLVALRSLLVAFSTALVLIAVVLLFIGTRSSSTTTWAALGLFGFGIVAVFVVTPRLPVRLDGTDGAALAAAYRSRFFFWIAIAELSAVLGFVGAMTIGGILLYVAGATPSAIGFLRAAPTVTHLARDQAALQSQGCSISLVTALRNTPWPRG